MAEISTRQRIQLEIMTEDLVTQGFDHASNIEEYYRIIYEAAEQEFTEDNDITLKSFMLEQFMKSLNIDEEYLLKMV